MQLEVALACAFSLASLPQAQARIIVWLSFTKLTTTGPEALMLRSLEKLTEGMVLTKGCLSAFVVCWYM